MTEPTDKPSGSAPKRKPPAKSARPAAKKPSQPESATPKTRKARPALAGIYALGGLRWPD